MFRSFRYCLRVSCLCADTVTCFCSRFTPFGMCLGSDSQCAAKGQCVESRNSTWSWFPKIHFLGFLGAPVWGPLGIRLVLYLSGFPVHSTAASAFLSKWWDSSETGGRSELSLLPLEQVFGLGWGQSSPLLPLQPNSGLGIQA